MHVILKIDLNAVPLAEGATIEDFIDVIMARKEFVVLQVDENNIMYIMTKMTWFDKVALGWMKVRDIVMQKKDMIMKNLLNLRKVLVTNFTRFKENFSGLIVKAKEDLLPTLTGRAKSMFTNFSKRIIGFGGRLKNKILRKKEVAIDGEETTEGKD